MKWILIAAMGAVAAAGLVLTVNRSSSPATARPIDLGTRTVTKTPASYQHAHRSDANSGSRTAADAGSARPGHHGDGVPRARPRTRCAPSSSGRRRGPARSSSISASSTTDSRRARSSARRVRPDDVRLRLGWSAAGHDPLRARQHVRQLRLARRARRWRSTRLSAIRRAAIAPAAADMIALRDRHRRSHRRRHDRHGRRHHGSAHRRDDRRSAVTTSGCPAARSTCSR